MKYLTIILVLSLMTSCNSGNPKESANIYRFEHSVSGQEVKNLNVFGDLARQGKLIRVDLRTGERTQYTHNNY